MPSGQLGGPICRAGCIRGVVWAALSRDATSEGSAAVLLAAVGDLRTRLAAVPVGCADSERIDLIAELERVKSAAAAAQARLTAALADGHLH